MHVFWGRPLEMHDGDAFDILGIGPTLDAASIKRAFLRRDHAIGSAAALRRRPSTQTSTLTAPRAMRRRRRDRS